MSENEEISTRLIKAHYKGQTIVMKESWVGPWPPEIEGWVVRGDMLIKED